MRMKHAFRLVALTVLALGLLTGTASAQFSSPDDRVLKIEKVFDDPWAATHSDFAFWGDHAVLGWYNATGGGLHIYDISNPASPEEIRNFSCNGQQNDPILWDRNGNGVADLLLLAVDRTMEGPSCSDAFATRPNPAGGAPLRFDAQPDGWEGVRVFEMSDGSGDYEPGAPFAVINQVDAQYTDCGAHTITAHTGFADDPVNPRLVVYVSSYPLRPGPTCGQTGSLPGDPQPFQNVNNPFEEAGDKEVENPLHGVIQVLNVPLNNPENTTEIAEPEISYPGDPDGKIDWCERSVTGSTPDPATGQLPACPGAALEPAAIACHDIVIHVPDNIAGGACAEQGQVWEVDPDTGIPDTENPMAIGDDKVSSGGTGQFPGAVDFFHSVMFDNGMETINWVDESFGRGCPPMTAWRERPWHPAATHQTGYMYFSDMEGNFQSRFHVGDLRPDPRPGEYCSSHMGMTVTGINRDLLVNAWYTGGVDVIDFTNPTRPREVAYYDMARQTGTWSAYPYTGPMFKKGPGIPVYASDGVELNPAARGMEVYRPTIQKPGKSKLLDHLNPQTMEE
jgi:LVIVD repeat